MRERLGMSQHELADELGFSANGPNVVRRWEHDPDFQPTPLAWRALRMIYLLVVALENDGARVNAVGAMEFLRANVPESLL